MSLREFLDRSSLDPRAQLTVRQSSLPDYVTIGDHSYGAELSFHRWRDEKITIGKFCSISQHAKFLAGGNHRTDAVTTYPLDAMMLHNTSLGAKLDRSYEPSGDIIVGNDVWIGFGATLVGGMCVGDGAVIASHAVVFNDVPPYGIAVGNPAKVLKYRFSEEIITALSVIGWWDWSDAEIQERAADFYRPVKEFVEMYGGFKKRATEPEAIIDSFRRSRGL